MTELEQRIAAIQADEQELIFDRFTSEDALAIGHKLIDRAKAENQRIAIHITLNRRVLFHFAFDGTSPNNDHWIMGKENVVYHFFMSSMRMELMMQNRGTSIPQLYGHSTEQYKAAGGSFPLSVKGAGIVGTITVSGMASTEDHTYVVDAIRAYLGR